MTAATIVFCLVVLFGIICAPFLAFDWRQCSARSSAMGIDYRWGPVMGCMQEIKPGKWMPAETVTRVDLLP